MPSSLTRRAALFGAAASSAALAVPVAAARELAPSHCRINVAGRTVLVDTSNTPTLRFEREPIGDGPRTLEVVYSEPDPEAEYLILTHDGQIAIARLEANSTSSPMVSERTRLGYVPGQREFWRRTSTRVSVLGRVLEDVA